MSLCCVLVMVSMVRFSGVSGVNGLMLGLGLRLIFRVTVRDRGQCSDITTE